MAVDDLYGKHNDFLFFWGHHGKGIGKHCLSQWYPCEFEIDGVVYHSTEQYMMAKKALLFGDAESYAAIMAAADPRECKRLGREVRGFNAGTWKEKCFDIVVQGNIGKFSADNALWDYLLSTDGKILVEASPADNVWGIGLAADDPDAKIPEKWKGTNLLGFALMEARERLKEVQR